MSSLYADALAPFLAEGERLRPPGAEAFDAHTHLGVDEDGRSLDLKTLLSQLDDAGARRACVFPLHDPERRPSYSLPNDRVLAWAGESEQRLIPFCRLDPAEAPVPEGERCIAKGARGIKLHPRAQAFAFDGPEMDAIFKLAQEAAVPILIHAGRGIPALGLHAVQLAGDFPDARLILAHAAICDLSWIWRVAADHPNLLFDTAWWMPADLLSLFSLVPPGQILFASDAPYGTTSMSAVFQLRYALQLGLSQDQIRCITSGQALRIAAGEPLAPAGPAIGEHEQPSHVLLERVSAFLMLGALTTMRGGDGAEMLALARLACDVPEEVDDAPVFAAIRDLIDIYDRLSEADATDRRRFAFLVLAATVARTPEVPVPASIPRAV